MMADTLEQRISRALCEDTFLSRGRVPVKTIAPRIARALEAGCAAVGKVIPHNVRAVFEPAFIAGLSDPNCDVPVDAPTNEVVHKRRLLLRVVWANAFGDESKAHLASNMRHAICGQFLGDFHIIPEWYGDTCTVCKELEDEYARTLK